MSRRKGQLQLLRASGTTLLEVVLALSLTVILMMLLSTLGLNMASHYKAEEEFFLLQQHLSLGLELMEKELKQVAVNYPAGLPSGFLEGKPFFVADSGRKNSEGAKIYVLYRKDGQGHATELIEDIDTLILKPEREAGTEILRGLSIMMQATRGQQRIKEYGFISLRGRDAR